MAPGRMSFRPALLAIAVATVGVLPGFMLGGLAVQVRGDLGFGADVLGLAVAAFFATSSLLAVVAGRAVERLGSHWGMRLAAAGSAVSLVAVALLARSWWGLVGCLVIGGIANSMAQPAANLSLAKEVPDRRQGLSFGIKQSAIPAATLISGLTVPALALTLGWRWAFVMGAALALAVALLIPTDPSGGVSGVKDAREGDARSGPLVLLALGIGLGSTAAAPLGSFLVGSSVSAGLGAGAAGLLLAAGSACNITVRISSGYFADRMSGGRLRLVAGMLGVGVVGFVMLATGAESLLVAGTVLAFGAGWGWTGLFNFAVVRNNPGAPAAATGITQTGASGGAAAGPLVFGLVVEASSYTVAWLISGALALFAVAVVLCGRHLLLRDRAAAKRPVEPGRG